MTAKEQASLTKKPASAGDSLSVRELTKRQYSREVQLDQEQGKTSRTYPDFLQAKGLLGLKARVDREADQA